MDSDLGMDCDYVDSTASLMTADYADNLIIIICDK